MLKVSGIGLMATLSGARHVRKLRPRKVTTTGARGTEPRRTERQVFPIPELSLFSRPARLTVLESRHTGNC